MDDAALRAKVPIRICSNSKPIEPYTRVEKIRWEKRMPYVCLHTLLSLHFTNLLVHLFILVGVD